MNDRRVFLVHDSTTWRRPRRANRRRIGWPELMGIAALACFPTIAQQGEASADAAFVATPLVSDDATGCSGNVLGVGVDNDLVVDLAANGQLIDIGTGGQVCP